MRGVLCTLALHDTRALRRVIPSTIPAATLQARFEFNIPSWRPHRVESGRRAGRAAGRRCGPLWHLDYAEPDMLHWVCLHSDEAVAGVVELYDDVLPMSGAELHGPVSAELQLRRLKPVLRVCQC